MIAWLLVLAATVAGAQESGESKFARGLLRRLAPEGAPSIVIFTADDGRSCRPVLDQFGLWAARGQRVHLVEGSAEVADFLINSSAQSTRFGRFADEAGLVIIPKNQDVKAEDRILGKLADLILMGGDREVWRFNSTDRLRFVFEARATAPFMFNHILRSVLPLAEATTSLNGCHYHLFSRETLRTAGTSMCRATLEPRTKSGWFREE